MHPQEAPPYSFYHGWTEQDKGKVTHTLPLWLDSEGTAASNMGVTTPGAYGKEFLTWLTEGMEMGRREESI